eukprot:TRINITY_DN24582_c0_g1_i1.p1 TRINITY_DN24582_c0_g1~~TRINITY_DN24582_c0_g1_i1.p1  ORF type:complete len:693 (+),score=125.48 TRINITY_DN24582_c0_g1_i1:38-2080(+)
MILSILVGSVISALEKPDIMIIGSGASAIGAVGELHKKDIETYKVLEASTSTSVGGRIRTYAPTDPTKGGQYDLDGLSYEVGASWIMGTLGSENHPLKVPIEDAQLETKVIDWSSYTVLDSTGTDITTEFDTKQAAFKAAYDKTLADCDKMTASQNGIMDISLKAMLKKHGWSPTSPLENMVEWRSLDFEYASQSRDVSCAHHARFTYEHFGNDDQAVTDSRGFSYLLEKVLETAVPNGYKNDDRFLFGKKVTKIDSSVDKQVTVTCSDDTTYTTEFVLITVPLGVLQDGGIEFVPPLPDWKSNQIQQHSVQSVVKVFATYDPAETAFWPNKLMTLITHDTPGGRWASIINLQILTGKNVHRSTIVAMLVGDEGRRLEWMTDASILAEFNSMINAVFSSTLQPVHFHVTKWGTDANFKGSRSTWNIGLTSPGHELAYSPQGTIFFAGEHTSKYYGGSVSGAYESGVAAINKITECNGNFRNNVQCSGSGDYLLNSIECQASSFIRFTASGDVCAAMPVLEESLESKGDVILQNSFFYDLRDYNSAYICKQGRMIETLQGIHALPQTGFEIVLVVATHLLPEELLQRVIDAKETVQNGGLVIDHISVSLDPITIIFEVPSASAIPVQDGDDSLPEYAVVLLAILCVISVALTIALVYQCYSSQRVVQEGPSGTDPDQMDQS